MICTSSYSDFKSDIYTVYSISWDCGADAGYTGKCYSALAPKKEFWREWKNNIGKISFEENTKFYIRKYWEQVLSKLNPEKVYSELDGSILLCYEPHEEFCHRGIIAAWWKIFLGLSVPEVKNDGYKIEEVSRPEYYEEYLEEIIRTSVNMHGFNSLRAWYLFEQGEMLEAKADELEKKTGKCYDSYRQTACFLRCDAYMADDEYIRLISKSKTKIK